MIEFEYLRQLVEQAQKDLSGFQGGSKAAGVRLRKAMQDVRKTAAVIRTKVLAEIKQRTEEKLKKSADCTDSADLRKQET